MIVGLAVTVAYLRAEYASHLRAKAGERSKQQALHDLHASGVRPATHIQRETTVQLEQGDVDEVFHGLGIDHRSRRLYDAATDQRRAAGLFAARGLWGIGEGP